MRLLVSVRDADEAGIAVAAGADIVDVKDPSSGALQPVPPATLAAVAAVVPAGHPLGVALGEPADVPALLALVGARAAVLAAHDTYVKFVPPAGMAATMVEAVRAAAPRAMVVVAGYADALGTPAARHAFLQEGWRSGADGVLFDTRAKDRGLLAHVSEFELVALAAEAHAAGCLVALAGSLGPAELPRVAAVGPDVIGVRGAACDGGRAGRLSAERLAALLQAVPRDPPSCGCHEH